MRASIVALPLVCLFVTLGCGPSAPADDASTAAKPDPTPAPAATPAPIVVAPPQPTAAPGAGGESGATLNADGSLAGKLSKEQIDTAVNKSVKLFDACYTLGADKDGKLSGTVTVKATVAPTGDVKEAGVTKSTVKNKKVDACVVDAFKKVKFPPPEGGSPAVITFPMKFDTEIVHK
ncbi:AgmX/PglI C-terminal domain-containing protein [Polyangium aurulentum]|uniref:AgmX/PglI C-terminal domain-containing protein n=1 Tax=Polyangium aurulentum TaxID=2567896 RepID=UPI0010AE2EC9|nr:AgmX/PglI C-terminal domain-containing protein [Polyangium aurulentum]UQA58945.1 TonB family protein [Polyangium aurulentum]